MVQLRGSGPCEPSFSERNVAAVCHFSEEHSCVESVALKMLSVQITVDCFGEEERRFFSGVSCWERKRDEVRGLSLDREW